MDGAILDDHHIVQLAPLLSPVLPIHIPDNEVTKHMSGESRMQATIWVMVAVLAAKLRDCRTALVFEDVHWMDSSSWALLRALVRDVEPLLVCLTLRPLAPDAQHQNYEALVKHTTKGEQSGVLELQGLKGPELLALLCDSLSVSEVPDKVLERIAEKSDGNPFWVKEFVKSMVEDHMVGEDGTLQVKLLLMEGIAVIFRYILPRSVTSVTRPTFLHTPLQYVTFYHVRLIVPSHYLPFQVDDINAIDFPASVEGLVTSRMDRLPASLQLTMKVASVLDADFTKSMVRTSRSVARCDGVWR